MATGQAIMVCRSPHEAVRLQIAYVQATLASGLEPAGQVAHLSHDIARDTWPIRLSRARDTRRAALIRARLPAPKKSGR
jgi:hypothetical protein